MKFSVLISVYKGEDPSYLDDSLTSIHNQTLQADQIVLVKDGPLSNELNLIVGKWRQQLGKKLDIVALKKNLGLARALNAGLKVCNYDWVARMDTDDVALEQRFQIQVDFLENNPQVSVLGSWISEHDEPMEKTIGYRKVPTSHEEILKYSKRRCPINHMTVFFKKEAVLGVGGYPYFDSRTNIEDYVLWALLLNQGFVFRNIPEVLVKARAGNSLLSRRGGRSYMKIEKYYLKKLKEVGFMNRYEYSSNVIIRLLIRLAPRKIRSWFYYLTR